MGFPMRIVLDPQSQNVERYQCSVCSDLLNNPHQDQCGHRLCLECHQKRSDSEPLPCRMCEMEGNADDHVFNPEYQPIPDYAIKREMMKLRVVCLNDGCSWKDCLKNLQSHLEDCAFKPFSPSPSTCPVCHNVLSLKAVLDDHIQSDVTGHFIHVAEGLVKVDEKVGLQNDILLAMHMQYNALYEKLKDLPTIAALKDQTEELKQDLIKSQALNLDLQQKQSLQNLTTHDGTLVWRISGFSEKMRLAENGQQTSIYSPFFYTDQYGFKACARLYLNGDGMARDSHISIFLVLVRGEYDALLQWPFKHSVSCWLLDQSTSKDHVNVAFKPDPGSSSFSRPASEMNLPSGFPYFLSLKNFQDNVDKFVVDDTAYVKVVIHTEKNKLKDVK